VFDLRGAFATLYRILKPGGVLLATVPGISQISDINWGDSWYWSLTSRSLRRLAEAVFSADAVEVESHGNVLSAIAFLQGLADSELTSRELRVRDEEYQLVVTLVATKRA
jgi:hypothetical protein